MKKIILFTLLIILATIGVQQTVQAAPTDTSALTTELAIPDTTKLTIREVYEDVKSGITGLALALKAPAEHVYRILIHQQYVKAIIGIFMFLLVVTFLILSLRYASFVVDWDDFEAKDGTSTFSGPISIIFGVLTLLFIIVFFAGGYFSDIIQGFVNPEYGAIKDIIDFVK